MFAISKKVLNYSGRASRSEYWLYAAPILLFLALALVYDVAVLGPVTHQETTVYTSVITGEERTEVAIVTTYGPRMASLIVALIALLPFSAMLTRRVHDIGSPGWHAWAALSVAFFFGPVLAVLTNSLATYSVSLAIIFGLLLGMPQLIVSILAMIVIVLWGSSPSEPDDNEYGPVRYKGAK